MTQKIKKILIANRGEIACRVMKTCRKMGIASVAVYSDADRRALHVRMADEAVHIGASPAAESYLVIDKIIKAAIQTGADAIHPGYGFLSENPAFVRACEKAKINFIGPSAESMEAMGLKDAAKTLMDKAGVPITPGYHGKEQGAKLLKAKAGMIGYPVLIKAVAGGGGKGMRKVEAEADFDAALASCQREAKSSFGNDDVLIEKYIQSPRHIEVQVFGDTHGNIVHMFERDCSLQRRHQKVIEEAPAPGMTAEVRKAMTDAAIEAARTVDYVGAGTVEFIVDGSGKLRKDGFWFMEMNTRLQVEHPVTEMITGLDLVELQIRVAQGEKLPKQMDIKMEGHAVEARLYAEDPFNNFRPSTGSIWSIDTNGYHGSAGQYRIDTGISSGGDVTVYYDPMIAKIIGYGELREESVGNTSFGVSEIMVQGIRTNARFLIQCLKSEDFIDGKIDTTFIGDRLDSLVGEDLENRPEIYPEPYALAALTLAQSSKTPAVWASKEAAGWRLSLPTYQAYLFAGTNGPITVAIDTLTDTFAKIRVGGTDTLNISLENPYHPQDGYRASAMNDALLYFRDWETTVRPDHIALANRPSGATARIYFPDFVSNAEITGDVVTAPMPGKIIAVNAKPGDTVSAGDPLIIMEAMKMEMTLEAPRDGVVAEVSAEAGALVSDGEVLLALEEES